MRWENPNPNGWFPRLSPNGDFVICGAGEVFIAEVKNDVYPISLGDGFAGAWLTPQWAIFSSNKTKTAVAVYNPYTKERREVVLTSDVANHNDLDAKDGIFTLTLANPGRVLKCVPNLTTKPVQCGVGVITPVKGLKTRTAGGYIAAIYDSNFIRRWELNGTIRDTPVTTDLIDINKEGEIGFGYFGPSKYIDTKGAIVDITATLWKKETPPVILNLDGKKWIFTGTEIPLRDDPNDPLTDQLVLGRFDSSGCLPLQRQPISYLDVVYAGGHFIVAGCTDRGQLVIQDVDVNAPLQPFPPDIRPPMPQGTIQFELSAKNGMAPLVVHARLTQKENIRTWRWLLNGQRHLPVEGDTHEFLFEVEGFNTIDVLAQGVLADDAHLPDSGGKLVYAGPQEVIIGARDFLKGFAGVQTGFGEPIVTDDNAYAELKSRHWQAARLGASYYDSKSGTFSDIPEMTLRMVKEATDQGLRPIVVCTSYDGLRNVPEFTDVEWFNEPNGTVTKYFTPEAYAATLPEAIQICRERNLRLWVGSINNLSRDGLSYLSKIIPAVPFDIGISVHRYPEKNLRFEAAHAGFESRQDEVDKLKIIIGSRPWCVTEFGYHQRGYKSCFRKVPPLTNIEIRDRIDKELQFFSANGADCAIWYQVWEGPEPDYGLMDINRKWKEPQSWRPPNA